MNEAVSNQRSASADSYRLRIAGVAALQTVAAAFEATTIGLLIPFLAAVGGSQTTVDLSFVAPLKLPMTASIGTVATILLAAVAGRSAAQTAAAWYWANSVRHFEQRRRIQLIEAFTAASWDCQSRVPTGKLQQLLTTNVEQVAKAFTAAAYSISHTVTLAVLVAYAFSISVLNSLAALVVLGALALAARPLTRRARAAAAKRAEAMTAYAHLVSQGASLTKELRVFGVVPWFTTSVAHWSDEIGATRRSQNLLGAIVPIIYQNGSGLLLVAGAAAPLAFGTSAAAASMIVSALLLIRAVSYGQQLHATWHHYEECSPYLDQLSDAQRDYETHRALSGTKPLAKIHDLEFRDVHFSYDGKRPALNDISFRVGVGDVVAVVGPSGSGKSTLAQLLLGLREPQRGEVRVNGEFRSTFVADDWFRRVAFVPQDLTLFNEPIEDGIRFHRPGVEVAQIRRAAEQAGILDEIERMPQGLQTAVGDRGGALSHGQRQRICIARALIGDPDLLIFDEPTSALDPDSEALILRTLNELRGRRIIFVLAHRSATLGVCNKVLVLRDGRVTAFRDVETASATDAYFRELVGTAES